VTTSGTTGVLGGEWRAEVTAWGDVVPWDGTAPLAWHVAADDRWHSPGAEVAVRQVRLSGAPVFETRLRIPGGDAVQRVWSVADGGGRTIVEIANDSPLPIACALTRRDLLTARPPAEVPIEGIDLPAGSIVLPIGHRTAVTVALDHHVVEPLAGDRRPTRVDGTVEAESRAPQHLGAVLVGPRRDLVVVTGDERRQFAGRGQHSGRRPPRQLLTFGVAEHRGQPTFGVGEGLHGNEHDGIHCPQW